MSDPITITVQDNPGYTPDLWQYCARGCSIREEMIAVSDRVELRMITFTPPTSTAPPVLFVPGWVTQLNSWGKALQELTKDSIVYYVESREKTSSILHAKVDLGVEAIARDIIRLTEILDFPDKNYFIFGSSLGATSILEASAGLTRQPLALVLVGPNAVFRIPKWGRAIIYCFVPSAYLILKPFIKWYLRHFRVDAEADPAQYAKYCANLDVADPYKLKRAALELKDYKVWDILPAVKYPVLIFTGSKDKLHEPGNIEKMAPLLPDCTVIDLETNTRTHSAEMVEEIRNFLHNLQ